MKLPIFYFPKYLERRINIYKYPLAPEYADISFEVYLGFEA